MNKKLFSFFLCALISLPFLASCSDDDEISNGNGPDPVITQNPSRVYVLNEGSWGKNNASLSAHVYLEDRVSTISDIYSSTNGKVMGDVAQDLVLDAANNRLYVAVSESRYIAKLDMSGREICRYATTEEQAQPRSLVLDGAYLYASLYGGMVAKFDTASLQLVATVGVGSYPEQMAVANNLLAVCNSGYGYDNTLSVIDLDAFTVVKTVVLPRVNPQHIVSAGGRFYCSTTEYDESWNAVSNIIEVNPANWQATEITTGFYLAVSGDDVHIIDQTVDYSTSPYSYQNKFLLYNATTGVFGDSFLASADSDLSHMAVYGISIDSERGDAYLCVSQQEGAEFVNSSVLRFRSDGSSCGKFTAGVLSKKVVALK
ncbi:MAG: hypothetical protein Q4B58_05150 [Bacteroidales bacterium]|nr:hypothetical protein [Bacteroidales bacterium]